MSIRPRWGEVECVLICLNGLRAWIKRYRFCAVHVSSFLAGLRWGYAVVVGLHALFDILSHEVVVVRIKPDGEFVVGLESVNPELNGLNCLLW